MVDWGNLPAGSYITLKRMVMGARRNGTAVAKLFTMMLITSSTIAFAQNATIRDVVSFSIPTQDVNLALTAFAEQADLTLVFRFDESDKQANELKGDFSLEEGIAHLLEGTGLTAAFSSKLILKITKTALNEQEGISMRKKIKKGFIAGLATMFVGAGAVAQNSEPNIEEVVVFGTLSQGQAQSLDAQRESGNVVNVIAREKFGLYPDQTTADSLQRIPGVSITRDQGEGELVQVRGVSEQFNMVMVNGERVPTIEADLAGRSFGLDAFQSYLVEEIAVVKALIPEMDHNALGAVVDLTLRKAGGAPETKVLVSSGTNEQQSEFDTFGDNILELAGVTSHRFFDDKFGILAAASLYETERGSLFRSWRYNDEANTDIRRRRTSDYDIIRDRRGLVLNVDYAATDTDRWNFTYNLLRYEDEEIRSQVRYNLEPLTEERRVQNRLEDQKIDFFKLVGEHEINEISLDYGIAYITGEETVGDLAEFRFRRNNPDLANLNDKQIQALTANTTFGNPEDLAFLRGDLEKTFVSEDHLNYTFNIATTIGDNSELKGGIKLSTLEREFSAVDGTANLTAETPVITTPEGTFSLQNVVSTSAAYNALNLDLSADDLDLSGSEDAYTAEEEVLAAYIQYTTQIDGWSIVGGVRAEQTDQDYIELFTGNIGGGSYTDVLPSIHAKLKLSDGTQFRASYSSGISRPNYQELIPVNVIDTNASQVFRGNPGLETTKTKNLDLAVEHYTDGLGFYSIGLFGKFITDPIVERSSLIDFNGEEFELIQNENGGEADIFGVELDSVVTKFEPI